MVLVYADRDELQILDVFFEAQIEEMSLKLFRRRLRAEGAKPESNNRWKMGSGHVCIYVCMFFANFWRFKGPSESKVVPYDSHVNSTLLRHVLAPW